MVKLLKSTRRRIADLIDPARSNPAGSVIPRGFVPMGEYRDNDLFIIGFPKSGHTWCQNLVTEALYGFNTDTSTKLLVQDLVPDIHYKTFFKRYTNPMFFKAHALPEPAFKNVIYLLRDGRDAMVSYWHFLQAMQKQPLDFLRLVQSGEGVFPCKWHLHVSRWLENPYGARMITVRYESLIENTAKELERIMDFAGIRRTAAQIETAVQRSSFDTMQKHEKAIGMEHPEWPKDRLFVRRGKIGSYKDEMPSEVQQAFMSEAEPLMKRLGYVQP